jgi:hypothetical protein
MNAKTIRGWYKQISLFMIVSLLSSLSFAEEDGSHSIPEQSLLPSENSAENPKLDAREPLISRTRKSNDPVSAFGHGHFFNNEGKPFTPNPESIRETQAYYLSKLNDAVSATNDKKAIYGIKQKRSAIEKYVNDKIIANALLIDVILEYAKSDNKQHIDSVNQGLRHYYINEYQKEQIKLKQGIFTKGIRPEIGKMLEQEDITVFLKTNAGGDEYIQECRDAGVPIPPPMYEKPWENRGTFANEFISEAEEAELWFYESESPKGACLALPRYSESNPKVAQLLGLICLGKETSKACFWDNPNGILFERDKPVDINKFVGGADLNTNGQGTCTACHAGENPFVVHPDKDAFSGLSSNLQPDDWHEPLVHPSWPENPGPTNILDFVSSEDRCDTCHFQGYAGRFPDVSDPAISSYCTAVLETSVFGGAKRTMPQGGGSLWGYFNHVDALLSACFGDDVEVDPIPDDVSFISPPIIIDPLYACATQLAVRGTILDAKVSIYINGFNVASKTSRSPSELSFDVPELQVGDVVTAIQEFDGTVSDPSDPVTVRDHKMDFPSGLPTPKIDPDLIYECGNTVAARHVPGAKLTVFVNGGDPRTSSTSTGWSSLFPGKYPFDLGDEFTASIELCSDSSPISDIETAVASPGTINAPTFNPPEIYAGQELVTIESILHGAWVEVGEASAGALGKFSTPVSWKPEYDVATKLGQPLMAGNQLYANQTLCDSGPNGETPPARECEDIPAPKIRIPLEGEEFVVVTEAVPGARIHVYDSSNKELGDGSGNVIALNRALMYDEQITVTQSIGDCKGKFGYKVRVRRIEREKRRGDGK